MTQQDIGRVAQAVANLDFWLESMRQQGGYGGPVAHWWRQSLLYTGPGIDWRYEGILAGYGTLYRKTGNDLWRQRTLRAVDDVVQAQRPSGGYGSSSFEINPAELGTPHEAAVDAGLLRVIDLVHDRDQLLDVVRKNFAQLILRLWDEAGQGFNDRPGTLGRVPNKLATLAEALMLYTEVTGDEQFLDHTRSCLDDVCRYTVLQGAFRGAVQQYAHGATEGDNRFFPFYAARCVGALVKGASMLQRPHYLEHAHEIGGFLERVASVDGSWPQIVYGNRRRAESPRWIAGAGDIVRALIELRGMVPSLEAPLVRILDGQMASGGISTAEGFASLENRRLRANDKERSWLDRIPVAGWNDKAFRLLSELLPDDVVLPEADCGAVDEPVLFGPMAARYFEDAFSMRVTARERVMFSWSKADPWAHTGFRIPAL